MANDAGGQARNTMRGRRAWTCAVFAVVLLTGAYAVAEHPKQYYANSTVVIVGAPTVPTAENARGATIDPATQSPLARYNNTRVVGDIFAKLYQSRGKRDQLAAEGLVGRLMVTTKSNVASETPDHGPVLVFTVSSPTPADAVAGARLVTDDMQREIQARQAGYDPYLSVSMAVASMSDNGVLVSGSRIRSAVAFFALAMILAWVTGRVFDAATGRRGREPRAMVVSA